MNTKNKKPNMLRANKPANDRKTKRLKAANRLLLAAFALASAAYLVGTNDLSIKNYMLLSERLRANAIRNEINQLEVKAMSLSSFSGLKDRIAALEMVKVDQVNYLNANPAVALK